jgi:hypothetical protein
MAVMGILAGLIIGTTGSALRSHKETEFVFQQNRDIEDSLRDYDEYSMQTIGGVQLPVPAQKQYQEKESRQHRIQKLIDRGYSSEVANVLVEDEDRRNQS